MHLNKCKYTAQGALECSETFTTSGHTGHTQVVYELYQYQLDPREGEEYTAPLSWTLYDADGRVLDEQDGILADTIIASHVFVVTVYNVSSNPNPNFRIVNTSNPAQARAFTYKPTYYIRPAKPLVDSILDSRQTYCQQHASRCLGKESELCSVYSRWC